MWSHGLDYGRQRSVAEEVARGDTQKACENGIGYIILSEIKKSYKDTNEEALLKNNQLVYGGNGEEMTVLKVRCEETE